MTPEQALQILDSAIARITTDRQTHSKLSEALRVLSDIVKAHEDAKLTRLKAADKI